MTYETRESVCYICAKLCTVRLSIVMPLCKPCWSCHVYRPAPVVLPPEPGEFTINPMILNFTV